MAKASGSSMTKVMVPIAAIVVSVALMFAGGESSPSLAIQETPSTPQVVISSEVLGRATPVAVEDPELSLGRVTIMPGAIIPVHHHPGTQIGVVVQGTLTYTVYIGEVEWLHANGGSESIRAGETVQVQVGDALVEEPSAIHQGRNDGNDPVVIYLSTLFPTGAPRSTLGQVTPTP